MGKHGHTHTNRKDNKSKFSNFLTRDKTQEQEYGQISKCLGDCRFLVKLIKKDDIEVKTTLPRRFQKGPSRKRIDDGHFVLIQSISKDMWEIIHVYSDIDIKRLRNEGELEEDQTHQSSVIFEDDNISSISENDGIVDGDLLQENNLYEDNLDAFITDI